MNRSLQTTTTAAALGLLLAAPLPAGAQWMGNMGQRMRDFQEQQNQALQRLRNMNRPRFTTPGVIDTTRRAVDDFYVDPDPIPEGQGGAGGRGDRGLEADGQGAGGQHNDDRDRHNSSHWGFGFRVAPTFVVRQRVVVSPSTTYVTPATPQENFLPTPSVDVPDVVLLNPTRNGGPVNYMLNNTRCTMAAGFQQKLPGGQSWIIEFDRGGSFGTARYSLTPGKYAFAVTERGWDVFRRTASVTAEAPIQAPAAPDIAQASP